MTFQLPMFRSLGSSCVLRSRVSDDEGHLLILGDFFHTLVKRDCVTWCITDSVTSCSHLKLFAILLSGKIDANVAEIWFFQMQNCVSWNTNEDDDQTFT